MDGGADMKVIFRAVKSFTETKTIGSITLIAGELRYSGKAKAITEGEGVRVIEPNTLDELTPDDGERWLRALPYTFHGYYLWAEVIE